MRRNCLIRAAIVALGLWPAHVLASDVLATDGYSSCRPGSDIQVQKLDLTYDRDAQVVTFDVHGTNSKVQNVTGSVTVYAYGRQVYTMDYDPCSPGSYTAELCPIPSGTFGANGSQQIPPDYANKIPSIAFSIPDLDGQAKIVLKSTSSGEDVACITVGFTNGKTAQVPAVSYAAAGVAGAALAVTGLSTISAIGMGHAVPASNGPGFGDVMGWFHSMATNGMLSVSYPPIYRSFAKNFAFSTGLIPWGQMQSSIDNFRRSTGGNLTADSYALLRNTTLKFSDGSSSNTTSMVKRAVHFIAAASDLIPRDISTSVNMDSTTDNSTSSGDSGIQHVVSGIKAYVEQLSIPHSNTFMTVLLIFAIVVAAIVVGILLCKVILEAWALYGTFPKKLTDFRKDYWGLMARTITNLILILYGIWVLYCIYQFTNGDSWAAKILAAVTLALFTAILAFFTFRIWQVARRFRNAEGNASGLYEDQETWRKYSLFYESYKKDYWWVFIPVIVYSFAKGCIIAAGNGHGLAQSAGQLIIEALMLLLLSWNRPYVAKSAQWINITIQVVRVLSIACVLIFVEELGFSQTTKTVTGVVIMAIQSGLTGLLTILIIVNAIIACIRENPHARRRREAEKMNRDMDDLTPLDARESLLMEHPPVVKDYREVSNFNFAGPYEPYRDQPLPKSRHSPAGSTDRLVDADYYDNRFDRSVSHESRQTDRSGSPAEFKPITTNHSFTR